MDDIFVSAPSPRRTRVAFSDLQMPEPKSSQYCSSSLCDLEGQNCCVQRQGILREDSAQRQTPAAAAAAHEHEHDSDDESAPFLRERERKSSIDYGTWSSSNACRVPETDGFLLQRPVTSENTEASATSPLLLGGTRSCPTPPKNSNKRVIHRCQTSPAVTNATRGKRGGGEALERPEFEKGSSIVLQAGIGVMVYLAAGVLIYTWKNKEFSGLETNSFVDGLYFCVVTMCTIGYGDIVPVTPFTKFFACGFVLVGFGFIDALVSGMVTYMLDKQEHLLLSAVEGSHHQAAKKYVLNPKHGNRMRIRVKVGLALGIPILCIVVGTLVMMHLEKLHWIDALYCTIMSVTTVGYGDHTFKSFQGRLFAALWLLFSTLAVARCFLYLAEVRVDKRHRAIAKWVLRRGLTFADLVQADLDHNGCISKAEFVIYKLREMGKLDNKDIADVIQEFTELDIHNTGKITRAYLQEGN
ncbi:unnamed protein product [Sphagnum troendelagicum]|uniref:Potassium channel domain-containing protein n=2 Tax=Sphagnum TaxID=13804 RepID=A0ABP0UB72_9BRYO